MVEKVFYSYKNMENDIDLIAESIDQEGWKPDVVVGILRGGIVPAVSLSHYYDVPLIAMEWSTRDQAVGKQLPEELLGYLFSESKILIIDDICDSGLTLREVYNHLSDRFFQEKLRSTSLKNVRTAVLHYNEGQEMFKPEYNAITINKSKKDIWLVYPWESING